MNDMLNSLEGFDSGSNYKFGDKMLKSNAPRSLFDLSHLSTLTIPNAGMIVPVTSFETLPNDDFDISIDGLVRVMPQVVPLYSRQRLYLYCFWSRISDLYNKFQVFMDKGYTGNVVKMLPKLNNGVNFSSSDQAIGADSLLDYFGLPIGAEITDLFGDSNDSNDIGAGINALKSMMTLRVYRDYFMNKNEWINDRVMLPDDDSRFRLDEDGCLLSAKDENKDFYFGGTSYDYNDPDSYDLYIDSNGKYHFNGMYHEYPDDYFMSALPFTQRGNTPTLDFTIDTSNIGLDFSRVLGTGVNSTGVFVGVSGQNGSQIFAGSSNDNVITKNNDLSNVLVSALNKGKLSGDSFNFSIALEQIRELAINQIELERLARTDGSYKQFGITFFGEASKASYDYRPLYVGGTYKNLVFTEVLQTAGSIVPTTAESGNSPLGAYAGHGITGITNGNLGHLHSDDYGLCMIFACIMPDIYYSQGLDKTDTKSYQEEMYLPDRAKLGMQPILNKELFYAGNNGNEEGQDNYLWAYQNPCDEYRYLNNKIHGKIADVNNRSFFPYTQSRKFDTLPNWGRSFSEANSVRKDYLFASNEDAYSAQFAMNIRAVRPLPYRAVPAQIV